MYINNFLAKSVLILPWDVRVLLLTFKTVKYIYITAIVAVYFFFSSERKITQLYLEKLQ